MKRIVIAAALAVAGLGLLVACDRTPEREAAAPEAAGFAVDYEKFTLDNGLDVIFHIDRSDPVVAISLTVHVGSAREKPGRTGFAHLFEHLLFLESENLGKGGLDEMSARIGGAGANGFTDNDTTNYLQTVPNDALEKMIWAEADKLGFFINTVTDPVLATEREVVKNEKRQSVDNRPYGHSNAVILAALYPAGHPYSWPVIGSLEDLAAATLDDVKDFFRTWYVPNNVTLVIAGDFDTAQARQWVEKYFGEFERGGDLPEVDKVPGVVAATKSLYFEDNFATAPRLTLVWPSVPAFHADEAALDMLGELLTVGKTAPFNKVLVEDLKITAGVGMGTPTGEIAGTTRLSVTAFPGTDLDDVRAAIGQAFLVFEEDGITDMDLQRIKAGSETGFYAGLGTVEGKGIGLGIYNALTGDPGYVTRSLRAIQAVTRADILRVYGTYVKDRPHVALSVVPKGAAALAVEGATLVDIKEEAIIAGAEVAVDRSVVVAHELTPSTFDRSSEPPYGPAPVLSAPKVWRGALKNGLRVFGIEDNEQPLVRISLRIQGGGYLVDADKAGVARLTAGSLNRGTATKTVAELEQAIDLLGASIGISAGRETMGASAFTLARNYTATLALMQEMLLQPRFDAHEFELLKLRSLDGIERRKASPTALASRIFGQLIYGEGHPLARSTLGTKATVEALSIDDVKAFYEKAITPTGADLHVVGAITKEQVMASLKGLEAAWPAQAISIPEPPLPAQPTTARLYFYDVPGAKQSIFRFGAVSMTRDDPDFYPASVMNYRLGGGGFASQLMHELREAKGYTYGISSGFSGSSRPGPFVIGSNVRANVTTEAARLIRDIVKDYGAGYGPADLQATQSYLLKSQARAFESLGAKAGMLAAISAYDRPDDYVRRNAEIVRRMTVADIQALAAKYIRPETMTYLIVGDAATQLEGLKALGLGDPILLDPLVD